MPARNHIFSDYAVETKETEGKSDPNLEVVNLYTALKEAKVTATTVPDYEKQWSLHDIPFSQIREAIPDHLFERNALMSLLYLAHDLFLAAILVFSVTKITGFLASTPLWFISIPVVWVLYWILIGIVGTGLWTIGHECGHGAFSKHKLLNATVGLIVHSAVFFPYFSFKITHGHHHIYNGSLMDASYVPRTRSQRRAANMEFDGDIESPLFRLIKMCLLGFPFYWVINHTGPYGDQKPSHFNPYSVIFKPSQFWDVVISNIGILTIVFTMVWASYKYSFLNVFNYYIVPVLMVNAWMVVLTYLQHTSPYLPRYRDKVWNFQRGAAITIDRSYGKILNYFFHHLGDAHVIHHYFPKLPHYHAVEATKYIKKVLGKYYCYDDTPIGESLILSRTECWMIEDTGDIAFYKQK